MIARVCQTVVHVAFVETNSTVSLRFAFFSVQVAVMIWIGVAIVTRAWA